MKNLNEYINEGLIRRQSGMDMKSQIEAWLNEHGVTEYIINDDLTISSGRQFHMVVRNFDGTEFPDYIQFGDCSGCEYFILNNCPNLETLRGCPTKVKSFTCSECSKLKSLEGGPQEVENCYYCPDCTSLKNLKGAPTEISRTFCCSGCTGLESLEGAPQVVGSFVCKRCGGLTNLKGAPQKALDWNSRSGQGFDCSDCENLESLEGAPQSAYIFSCLNCPKITSLKGIPNRIGRYFECKGCGVQFTYKDVRKHAKIPENKVYL